MRFVAWMLLPALLLETLAPARALADPLAPGTRVRLSLDQPGGSKRIGSFVEATNDSVWFWEHLHASQWSSTWTISHAQPQPESLLVGVRGIDVRRVEISEGIHRRVGRDALIGLAGGVVIGTLVGSLSHDESGIFDQAELAVIGAVVFGVYGLGLGYLVGILSPDERWRSVANPWSSPESP